jgi:biopolymer transport protein ExbD
MQKILFPEKPRKRPEIRITPLIDILLLLLIFFTISSRLRWSPGLTLDLPAASTSEPVDRPMRLVVMVDANGGIYVQGEEIPVEQLSDRLKSELGPEGQKQPTLELEADEKAPYGRVLAVIDEARSLGLDRIIAFTDTPDEGQ